MCVCPDVKTETVDWALETNYLPYLTKYKHYYIFQWGDGFVQWLERSTGDPKVEGLNPVRSTRKTEFSPVKKVVLNRYRCAQPLCVYIRMHTKDHVRTVKDPVVHVRVRWIMETSK